MRKDSEIIKQIKELKNTVKEQKDFDGIKVKLEELLNELLSNNHGECSLKELKCKDLTFNKDGSIPHYKHKEPDWYVGYWEIGCLAQDLKCDCEELLGDCDIYRIAEAVGYNYFYTDYNMDATCFWK